MYASIDKAADIISRRLQKIKEREEHGGVKKHHKVTSKISHLCEPEPPGRRAAMAICGQSDLGVVWRLIGCPLFSSQTPVHISDAVTDDVVEELPTYKTLDARSLPVEVIRRKHFGCERVNPRCRPASPSARAPLTPQPLDPLLITFMSSLCFPPQMSMEQAISNLEDLDHGFYVFRDQANGELQVSATRMGRHS